MGYAASTTLRDVGKLAAYVGYNIGGSVLIGLGRTAIATYHLAKTAFYKQELARRSASRGLMGRAASWVGHRGLDAKRKEWEGELVRGLVEMIPVLGSAYFTYKDYKQHDSYILGFAELGRRLDAEYALDSFVHGSNGSYNPLDYRFRQWWRSS